MHPYERLLRLIKRAAGFDLLQSLTDAKQVIKDDEVLALLDDIVLEYDKIDQAPAAPVSLEERLRIFNELMDTAQNISSKCLELLHLAGDEAAVDYFVENITKEDGLVTEALQTISDEYEISLEQITGEQPEQETAFTEFQQEQEVQANRAMDERYQLELERKRKVWYTLFHSTVPIAKDMWNFAKNEARKRFGSFEKGTDAHAWAVKWYNQRGGVWRPYKEIHSERKRLEWQAIKTDRPDRYKERTEGRLEEKEQWRKQYSIEKKRQWEQARQPKRRQSRLQERLEKLRKMLGNQ